MGRTRTNITCEECDDDALARGLCVRHYKRRWREETRHRERCIWHGCGGMQIGASFYCKKHTDVLGWEVASRHDNL